MAIELTDEEWEAPLDDETEAEIDDALANARDYFEYEVAVTATYVAEQDLLVLVLRSGRRVALPVEDLQGLAEAERSLVAKVKLDPLYGSYVRWEELDIDFGVLGLANGQLGDERWMASLEMRRRTRSEIGVSQAGIITVRTIADADRQLKRLSEAASKAHRWIAEQSSDPTEFLKDVKFSKKGFHPVTHVPINLIEQVNQTWTYRVALEATKLLLSWHTEARGFTVAPGAHAAQALDIMSIESGLVGAETFAATTPLSNGKLGKDLRKLADRPERYRYIFFASPAYPALEEQRTLEKFGVGVWSIAV